MAQILMATSDRDSHRTQKNMVDKQTARGAEYLGCGAFAITVRLNDSEILKVWRLSAGKWEKDGYLSYLRYASKTPSIFHPRAVVSAIIKCTDDRYVGVAKLEALVSNDARSHSETLSLISPLLNGRARKLEMPDTRTEILESTQSLNTKNLILSLNSLYADGDHGPDLHNGNWMLRSVGNGYVPVITDPVV